MKHTGVARLWDVAWGYGARFVWVVAVSLIVVNTARIVGAASLASAWGSTVSTDYRHTWSDATVVGQIGTGLRNLPDELPFVLPWVVPAAASGVLVQGILLRRRDWEKATRLATVYGCLAYALLLRSFTSGPGFGLRFGAAAAVASAWTAWNLRGARYRLLEACVALLVGCVLAFA